VLVGKARRREKSGAEQNERGAGGRPRTVLRISDRAEACSGPDGGIHHPLVSLVTEGLLLF
jgi:hypothetical protein